LTIPGVNDLLEFITVGLYSCYGDIQAMYVSIFAVPESAMSR